MEYSSRLYQPQSWASHTSKPHKGNKTYTNMISEYLYHLFQTETKTAILNKDKRTRTESATIDNNAKVYESIQKTTERFISPMDTVKKRIEEIATLNNNWNDHGAESFSPKLINRVFQIVNELPTPPEVFPTAVGAIQIEYHKTDGAYLEFEIYENIVNQFKVDKDGNEYESTMTDLCHINRNIVQAVVDFYE